MILDVIQHINDPNMQKKYLDQLQKSLEEEPKTKASELPSTSTGMYDLTSILNKKKRNKTPVGTIQELQAEVKTIKSEIKQLKEKQQKDFELIQLLVSKVAEESCNDDKAQDPLEH